MNTWNVSSLIVKMKPFKPGLRLFQAFVSNASSGPEPRLVIRLSHRSERAPANKQQKELNFFLGPNLKGGISRESQSGKTQVTLFPFSWSGSAQMATKIGDGWDRGICHEQQLECTEPHCACEQVRVCECVWERESEKECVCVSVRGSDGFHYSNENNDYSDSKQDSVKKKSSSQKSFECRRFFWELGDQTGSWLTWWATQKSTPRTSSGYRNMSTDEADICSKSHREFWWHFIKQQPQNGYLIT